MTTSPARESTSPARPGGTGSGSLPVVRLLAFTTAGFLAIMTETMPAGLLPRISAGLHISEALAGQFVSLYALGSVCSAVPVIAATRRAPRRHVLLAAVVGLLVFNTVTALSGQWVLTLAARFCAGASSGVVWGLLTGYTRRLVPARLQGRALALVGVGQPVALAFGVPLGTWLGSLVDWRGVFWIMSAVALLLLLWIRLLVPQMPGGPAGPGTPPGAALTIPGVRTVLAVTLLWVLAHNLLYTYIAPFLATSGLGGRVDVVLLVFGVAAMAGIWVTGLLVDRRPRPVTLSSLAVFAAAALALGLSAGLPAVVFAGTAAWGLTFGGAPTLLQTALADAAEPHTDVAQSMFVTVFNGAIAVAGLLGGTVLGRLGSGALPWGQSVLCGGALLLVALARRHAFRPGPRAAGGEEG
ncbi:MFS transporter [Streptomyces albus]|uniref:MFS transporter n=1 Tax=Streptomyces albus TaxID=1888 RepID=UPI0024AC9B3D|nr:MFS transporter [Streptomyces albus]MDI6410825.1 MFS transporter [Streptomyces albus]